MCTPWLLAETSSRTTYELSRLQTYTERWHYLALAVVAIAIVVLVSYLYRRDSVELPRSVGWLLAALRLTAFVGLLAYYLDLEKRTESKVVHNSRVLVLVDTSLSMASSDGDSASISPSLSRLEQVVSVLDQGNVISRLRQTHDVVLARFDEDVSRIVQLAKLPAQPAAGQAPSADAPSPTAPDNDWVNSLRPRGSETRLGQALRQLINEERAMPVAGIVVFSDGAQNAGIDPLSAVEMAREAKIPIFTVGVGSDRRPANVRVSDFIAPARAYPGDSFNVTGYIQAHELAGRSVLVELTSRAPTGGEEKVEASERITLGGQGEKLPVKFEITAQEKGRRTYRLRVKAPPEDANAADNQKETDVEIVDRKTKVLLVASGPTREYVFLRNQLRRDKQVVVDVWLQSVEKTEAVSQDANQLLTEFPSTPQELFEYDAIVAFDPNWQALNADQVNLLERWVGEKAGGLICIAGPVETDRWVQDPRLAKIRAMYPVEFNRRLALTDDARFGSTTPWPINFTREGLEAEFLWLGDSVAASGQAWASFPGVFGFYGVRGAKPGATVYGRYSDPEAAGGGEAPVLMAGQFYGSGRVFYLGSGEMWRLRALEDSYFEQFYTKLIRHVSQGRLLVGSSRGLLLVEDRYLLGGAVVVRASLFNAQFEPLDLPAAPLQIVRPDATVETLQLAADRERKGMFSGQFTAAQRGIYALELAVPESNQEQLTRRIEVRIPDLELENPERNDALLSEIAKATGGRYYVGADTVLGKKGPPPLVSQLQDRTKETFLSGVKDLQFDQQWMNGLLALVCGALCLEWLIRRFSKLA